MMRTALSIRGGGGSAQPPPLDADPPWMQTFILDVRPSPLDVDPSWMQTPLVM